MTAAEWVAQNPKKVMKHAGKWVAVTHKGIRAVSGDLDDVYHLAEKRGTRRPLVFKVPDPSRPRHVVSGKLQ